jgi:hypothetical protein
MSPKRTVYFSLIAYVLLFYSCADFLNKPPKAKCPQKITGITPEDVYDLSGYMASGGSSAFNLFDENDHFDPKNGETGTPLTSPQPTKQADIFFPLNKGNRIVVDLRVPYKLSEVYVYDQSHTADKVLIYTGSMTSWKLQTEFTTSGDPMGWGWRKFAVQDSTQFLMISFTTPTADLKEMILYGCATRPVPPRQPESYTGARLPRKTVRDFLGVNMYNSLPLEWLQPFHDVRMYTIANSFDTDTIHEYPNVQYSVSRYGYLYQQNSFKHFSDDLVADGKEIWYSVRGVPVWMNKKGMWDNDRPVTKIGMDPEDPQSYARHANMMWTLAAVFGKTKVDTNHLQINDMIKVTGKGTMTRFENGNEVDASWVGNKYCSPMEYYAQSSADYDGDMGRLGDRTGVHAADSNAELIMSGFVEFDTNRLKDLNFLCNQLRPDKKFLWQGGIQYHHYSNKPVGKSLLQRRKGTVSITPEEDSLRIKLMRVREHAYRLQPKVECILGEYGYDKSQLSKQATPIVPGYSATESQGIMLIRGINATAFSGFDRMIIYWMKDDVDENNPNLYLTSGLLREENGKFTPYPSWYYISTFVHHLGNFVADRVVSEKGNVWLYSYRQQSSADSLAYLVYCPTRNGTKVIGFQLQLPQGFSTATQVEFVSNSATGMIRKLPVSNGKITVDVSEVPKLILIARH